MTKAEVNDTMLVGDALRQFYSSHGIPADGGVGASSFSVRIGPVWLALPNPPARKRAVFYHDINHCVAGYNTMGLDGEIVISGFELGAGGCGPFWIAWAINLRAFAVALVTRPRGLFAAFVRGRRTTSIYGRKEDPAVLRAMTVAHLKDLLGIDTGPAIATAGDRIAFLHWAMLALLFVSSPLLLVAVVVAVT